MPRKWLVLLVGRLFRIHTGNSISRELLLGSFVEIGVTVFLFFVPNKDFGAFGTL